MSLLGIFKRWWMLQFSIELFIGTRKSFSPTVINMGVRNLAACRIGFCSRQIWPCSQTGPPLFTSREKIVSLVPHCDSRLTSPA